MRSALLALVLLGTSAQAAFADDTAEARLRDALKQSVAQMRQAQDSAAAAQAQLASLQAELATAKSQLAADEAKLAGGTAKPEQLRALQDQLAAAGAENAQLRQSLQAFEGRVGQAQDFARAREAEAQAAQAGLVANTKALQTCKAANAKLIDVSESVLNLWRDRSFLWMLRKSYEPLVGAAKVDLENLVQDYDNKIRDQEYVPPPARKG